MQYYVLDKEDIWNSHSYFELAIQCNTQEFILVRKYSPTLEEMKKQKASTLKEPWTQDKFWVKFGEFVCH